MPLTPRWPGRQPTRRQRGISARQDRSAHKDRSVHAYAVIALVALISACSPGTAEDHKRLDQLLADPITDYSPDTGDLVDSSETLGHRSLALGGDWDEHSSTVSRLWKITGPLGEAASDLLQALDEAQWEVTDERYSERLITIRAIKDSGDYCSVVNATFTTTAGPRANLVISAPYSGSDDDRCPDRK